MGFFDGLQNAHPPLVELALGHVRTMINHGHIMFAAATAHLLDNEILDEDLKALDDVINDCEKQVRRVVLEHLAVQPNKDLVFCLKMVSVVHEAERIGDLCKSLAKVTSLAKKKRVGESVNPLRIIKEQVLAMFKMMEEGFFVGDEKTAHEIMMLHSELKTKTAEFLESVSDDSTITANEAVVLAIGSRLIVRVSSHISNITSTVILPFDEIRNAPTAFQSEG